MYANRLLIDFSIFIITTSIGSFILKYLKDGMWFAENLGGAVIGLITLIASLVWRRKHENRKI